MMENMERFAEREVEDVLPRVREKMEKGSSDAANMRGQTLNRIESLLMLLRDNLDPDAPAEVSLYIEYDGDAIINFVKLLKDVFDVGLKRAKESADMAKANGFSIGPLSREDALAKKKALENFGAEVEIVE